MKRIKGCSDIEEAHFAKERKKRPFTSVDVNVNLKEAIKQERFTRRKRRIIQQRQGVANRQRTSRRSNGRHNGITDYENPEDLLESDDSASEASRSGAESWADTSSDSSESEESDEESDWNTDSKRKNRQK